VFADFREELKESGRFKSFNVVGIVYDIGIRINPVPHFVHVFFVLEQSWSKSEPLSQPLSYLLMDLNIDDKETLNVSTLYLTVGFLECCEHSTSVGQLLRH